MAAAVDDGDRVRCDPCLSVGDIEACFLQYFSRCQRKLEPLLDSFAQETWKTPPKALVYSLDQFCLISFWFRSFFFRSFLKYSIVEFCIASYNIAQPCL